MNVHWQCRLYGHDWRHPGALEVVVTDEDGPVYPLECQRCSNRGVMDRNGNRWRLDDEAGPTIHDRAVTFDLADDRAKRQRSPRDRGEQ